MNIETNSSSFENVESALTQTLKALSLPAAICLSGIALFWSLPANAQSFSCASAEKPAEFAICNSEDLLTMDEKLGSVFSTVYVSAATTPQRQAVVREHERWVKRRNACGNDVTCIDLRYKERLSKLSSRAS
jgi:uncharacterized protein